MIATKADTKGRVNLEKYNNDWFKTGAPGWKVFIWYFINIIFFINPLNPFSKIKCILLRLFGAQVGNGVVIKPSVNIKYPWLLTIGDHVWIGEHVFPYTISLSWLELNKKVEVIAANVIDQDEDDLDCLV